MQSMTVCPYTGHGCIYTVPNIIIFLTLCGTLKNKKESLLVFSYFHQCHEVLKSGFVSMVSMNPAHQA